MDERGRWAWVSWERVVGVGGWERVVGVGGWERVVGVGGGVDEEEAVK